MLGPVTLIACVQWLSQATCQRLLLAHPSSSDFFKGALGKEFGRVLVSRGLPLYIQLVFIPNQWYLGIAKRSKVYVGGKGFWQQL